MNQPQVTPSNDLFTRHAELVAEYEIIDDRLNEIHQQIKQAADNLQSCKTEFTIAPANDALSSQLKTANREYESLCDQCDELESQRKDMGHAVSTILGRISTQEAQTKSALRAKLNEKLPEKIKQLESEMVIALARYQAGQRLLGAGIAEPAIIAGRLVNKNRTVFLDAIELAKESLTDEMTR